MITTYFGLAGTGEPFGLCWLDLGMFPIEAYAYVATSVCRFPILCWLYAKLSCSSTIVSTCGNSVSTVMTRIWALNIIILHTVIFCRYWRRWRTIRHLKHVALPFSKKQSERGNCKFLFITLWVFVSTNQFAVVSDHLISPNPRLCRLPSPVIVWMLSPKLRCWQMSQVAILAGEHNRSLILNTQCLIIRAHFLYQVFSSLFYYLYFHFL